MGVIPEWYVEGRRRDCSKLKINLAVDPAG